MTTMTINRVLLNSADAKKIIAGVQLKLSTLSYSGTIDPLDFGVKSAAILVAFRHYHIATML